MNTRTTTRSDFNNQRDNLSRGRWTDFAVITVVSAAIGALTLYPAGHVRVGAQTHEVHLGDLFGFRFLALVVCALLVVTAGIELLMAKKQARIAATGFAAIMLSTTAWIVTVEGAALLIPARILPATVRRFTLGLGASAGPWFVLVLSLAAALACLGLLEPLVMRIAPQLNETRQQVLARLGPALLTAAGIVALGFGRTLPLATAAWESREVNVESWAISYVGPGSLIAVIVMSLCALAVLARWQVTPLAVIGAGAAWVAATTSGLLAATSSLLVETDIVSWAARRLGQDDFSDALAITGGRGATIMFVGAAAAGLGFAGQLAATTTIDSEPDDDLITSPPILPDSTQPSLDLDVWDV